MQLRDYLELKSQTVTEFAAEVHSRLGGLGELAATVTRVWRHVHGKRRPLPEDQVLYEDMTKGAVTASDWVALALQQKQPPDEPAEPVAAAG